MTVITSATPMASSAAIRANPAELQARMNRVVFKGTCVESDAAARLRR